MAALSAAVEVLKIAVRNLSDCFGEALANQKACADAKKKTDQQIAEVLELKQHVRNLDHDAMDQFVEKFNISQYLQKSEDKLKEKQDELMVRARRVLEEVSEAWAKVLELVDAMVLDVDEDGLPADADEGVQMRRYAGTAKLFLENNTAIITVSTFLQTQRIKLEKVMTAITTEVDNNQGDVQALAGKYFQQKSGEIEAQNVEFTRVSPKPSGSLVVEGFMIDECFQKPGH
ncbi:hypothetical protein quinque_005440 [Culex quinquefasciatus]